MKTLLFALAFLALGLASGPLSSPPTAPASRYSWRQLTAKAPFPGSYNFDLFATRTRAYAFHPEGIYQSADGISWQKTPLSNPLGNLAFADYVQFKGGVYALGRVEGNIERYQQTTRIVRTTDFLTWVTLAESSNLPKLVFYKSVVFQNKIWLFGGYDGERHSNAVYNSADGVHWQQVTPHAAWSPRNPAGVVVFQNRLYLMGGGEIDKTGFSDVWSSENGKDWHLETGQMHPTAFWGYKVLVFDQQLWLLGCNRSGEFTSEVLRSADGKTWQAERAPWAPRGAVAAAVFREKLLLTGGKFSERVGNETQFMYQNDVWELGKN